MMRRLPIFIVLDVSESMAGAAIKEVQAGIKLLTDALMSDPFAMETVYISLIAFAGKARTIVPLTYIMDFFPPELPIGNGTNLTEALNLLMHEIDTKVQKNTPESKGDWKPLIFILTDGSPNDNYQAAAAQWRAKYGKYSTVAVLMGEHSDATALKAVTDNVLVFKETKKESYQAFFKWVSASIQSNSKEIGEKGKDLPCNMDKIKQNMAKDLLTDELPTENKFEFFVISARCQKSGKPYIIRFVRERKAENFATDLLQRVGIDAGGNFSADGAYPVDESYFEFSGNEKERKVNIKQLAGGKFPKCPCCHAALTGQCTRCGKWFCVDTGNLRYIKCPHCGQVYNSVTGLSSANGGRG